MSNHHPGNEWYRRLIRSNRPLYRACPKHTKLLVAKAIVQAVQEQQGRFLERDLKNGVWYVIPYKRAVDKTSQGLREREREDPPARLVTDVKAMLSYPEEGPPQLPKPVAKKALPSNSRLIMNRSPPNPRPNNTTTTTAAREMASFPAAALPPPPPNHPPPETIHRHQTTMMPLPVDTQLLREASLYRLLKHTQLLPHQTSLMTTSDFRNIPSMALAANHHPHPPPSALPPPPASSYVYPSQSNYPSLPSKMAPSSYAATAEPATAPGLTRISSQVSDWLHFFWPPSDERPVAAEGAPPPPVVPPAVQEEEDAVAAAPTELEQSVSLTLLTLAGAPNKLFSGLFFGEQSKKKKDSLLDDHEETPMEQRMRSLPPPQKQQYV